MINGYTFDHEMRLKLARAAQEYIQNDGVNRSPLNEFIMSIQRPYLEVIAELTKQLKILTSPEFRNND